MDEDTKKIVSKTNKISRFAGSSDWREVKRLFVNKVVELNDLSTLSVDIEKLPQEIEARKLATSILMDWITDVEGSKNSQKENVELLRDEQRDNIIRILPD